ncbi:MAG TPA: PhoH family protein [Myxococcota bacterium]|jgi:PhoH-like ATPase|nr:PhoH family protein [Myxococcota bacterium]
MAAAPRRKRAAGPKTFVLDTNVLLHDPNALFRFKKHHVVVPIYVLEEIDTFKKELSELGRAARMVSRHLDELRDRGPLIEGVELPAGGMVRVAFTERVLPTAFSNGHQIDNRILALALDLRDRTKDRTVVFVTKDINLRIRADALGLRVEDYDPEAVHISDLWPGWTEHDAPPGSVAKFYEEGGAPLPERWSLPAETPPPIDDTAGGDDQRAMVLPNNYVLLRDAGNPAQSALGRADKPSRRIVPLLNPRQGVWGIRPRNKEQAYALDALLLDSVKLVTLVGKAGTGKTLLALAAGMLKVADERVFSRLLVARPIFPLGRDIGYLPGDIEEKLNPWMQPIYDNMELLMGLGRQDRKEGRSYQELIDLGMVQVEPLTYIRGRSIPQQFMIVDEAQNLTPHEVKTIITRAGDGTKIVLTGDPHQIDNPYIDASNNGLTYVVNKFREQSIAAHVSLAKGERSELAELAANLL